MQPTIWTPEMLRTLKRLHESGLSFRQVAKEMGVTRGAALGAFHRMKLPPDKRGKGNSDRWTEERLTERWADRKKAGYAQA